MLYTVRCVNGQFHGASIYFPGKLLDGLHYYIFMASHRLGNSNIGK
jgi:hypothetical protein